MSGAGDSDDVPELVEAVADTDLDGEGARKKVPITIVTGYLGAGKTTLLNYILTAEHGKKIAVILNEFGNTTDIEKSLTVAQDGKEATEWIPLANGCICCSVKDSGVAALESLVERQKNFDYILLETTGVADPGNIAPMFWMDEGINSSIYLDGIVTVVDAKNILKNLDEPLPEEIPQEEKLDHAEGHAHSSPLMSTAHLQISHADVVLINKTDLVSESQLQTVIDRIRSINGLAKHILTQNSRVESLSGIILDIHAYDSFPVGESIPDFTGSGHSHLDPTISTKTINLPQMTEKDLTRLEECLQDILWPTGEERGYDIHRTKGLIRVSNGSDRVIQGVREIFEIIAVPKQDSSSESGESLLSKVVFIGRDLRHVPDNLGWVAESSES